MKNSTPVYLKPDVSDFTWHLLLFSTEVKDQGSLVWSSESFYPAQQEALLGSRDAVQPKPLIAPCNSNSF